MVIVACCLLPFVVVSVVVVVVVVNNNVLSFLGSAKCGKWEWYSGIMGASIGVDVLREFVWPNKEDKFGYEGRLIHSV